MNSQKLFSTAALAIALSTLALPFGNAQAAGLKDILFGSYIGTVVVVLSPTTFTKCGTVDFMTCHSRNANEVLVEEAMEFRSSGKMSVDFNEKLEAIRAGLKEQNLNASMSDEDLSQLIVEGHIQAQKAAE